MPPGGTKRVRDTPGSETAPGVATRSGKKYITTHPARDEEQSNPQPENSVEPLRDKAKKNIPQVLFWTGLFLMNKEMQMKMRSMKS
jgi:hypothetical protein